MKPESIEIITLDTLKDQVRAKQTQGCRLAQISATTLAETVELTYSFDLNNQLSNLRLTIPSTNSRLPSVSDIFGCAALYENEIHDLFGVPVDGMTVDFKGNFYKTSVKYPFGSTKSPCAKPAPAAAATPAATPAASTTK